MAEKTGLAWAFLPALFTLLAPAFARVEAAAMTLAENGAATVPLIVPADAPPSTVQAAGDLAVYLEKITGSRPPLLAGDPQPTPVSAVWVGFQPRLGELFPGTDFAFDKPEEILLACNGRHLAIVGRDRVTAGIQVEHGTANAVYTFLQEHLGVRWLWPGELGEDVPRQADISLEPFEYRFNPPFRQRRVLRQGDWARFQRVLLDSLDMSAGHAFGDWWVKYHEAHPDYFALQPDGTRSGHPSPGNAKLCESNPAVWAQWLENVTAALERNPTQTVFNAAPNDGSNSGICICEACRAWDHPDGPLRMLSWQGHAMEYPAMSDRYVTFWNTLARMLRARFPDRELFVSGFAYGPAKPAPIAAVPDDNVIIGYVGHFPLSGAEMRTMEKDEWAGWAEKAPHMIFRPNLFYYTGGWHALPTLALRKTAEDFRFLAERGCVGIIVDGMPAHWAPQGVQYYLMAQLAWNPFQDGEAVIEDFCRRGFGPAAAETRAYFDLWDRAHDAVVERPGFRHGMGVTRAQLSGIVAEVYTPELLDQAGALLAAADARAAGGPEIYRQRLDFIRAGLDFTRLQTEIMATMTLVRESTGRDTDAVKRAIALCEARQEIFRRHGGLALNAHLFNITWRTGRGLEDFLGPPSETFRLAAGLQKQYRWTGGADNIWSRPGNWQVRDGSNWVSAAEPPGPEDFVRLGDATVADAPQTIVLDREATVTRLTFEATGRRAYTLAGRDGADAGEPVLGFSDPLALELAPAATADLRLRVETVLTSGGDAAVALTGAGARLVLEKPLRATGRTLTVRGGGKTGEGVLELQAPVTAGRLVLAGGATLLLNHAGVVLNGGFTGQAGTEVLVARDAVVNGDVYQFGGRAVFRAHGVGGDKEVKVSFNSITRGGEIALEAPAGNADGILVLSIHDIDPQGGNIEAPILRLAENTLLELRGEQPPPTRADRAAGIHGAGGLVKTAEGSRARAVAAVGERNTCTGGTFIRSGATLRLERATIPADARPSGDAPEVTFDGQLGPGPLYLADNAAFLLNGLDQEVSALADLSGAGRIELGGGRLTVNVTPPAPSTALFSGVISGPGALVKTGPAQLTLAEYTNEDDRTLRVEEGLLAVNNDLSVRAGGFELAGGRVSAGSRLDSAGQIWRITLDANSAGRELVRAASADISGARLDIVFADGYRPAPGTVFTILWTSSEIQGATVQNVFGHADGATISIQGVSLRISLGTARGAPVVRLEVAGNT